MLFAARSLFGIGSGGRRELKRLSVVMQKLAENAKRSELSAALGRHCDAARDRRADLRQQGEAKQQSGQDASKH